MEMIRTNTSSILPVTASLTELEHEVGTMTIELPECPVCFQPYDESLTVPRVLPCGHSACERCLALLPSPPPHPGTIRCPSCNNLLRLPHLGPKSFPKNIDLLRLIQPTESKFKIQTQSPSGCGSKPKPESDFLFLPRPWTDHALLQLWNPWILPQHSISLLETPTPTACQPLSLGNCSLTRICGSQHGVSLLAISMFSREPKWFQLSYAVRVMKKVSQLRVGVRAQLQFLLETCSTQRSGICRVLGLWMNPDEESSPLFLVCERFNRKLSIMLNNEGKRRPGFGTAELFGFGMVGMEVCEVMMSFHSNGIVFGCLDIDCFHIDIYGHCLLDLNIVLLKAKKIQEDIESKNFASDESYGFLSPEAIVELRERGSVSVDQRLDVWSLGCILAMILTGDAEHSRLQLKDYYCLLLEGDSGNPADECLHQYEVWRQKMMSRLETLLTGTKFASLLQILSSCLNYLPENRPQVRDIWCCIRGHFIEVPADSSAWLDVSEEEKSKESIVNCLHFWDVVYISKESHQISLQQGERSILEREPEVRLPGSSGNEMNYFEDQTKEKLAKGLQGGEFKFDVLQCHRDCVTGLVIGGAYLFSSSFDKTVNVWSLQDFSHVQSLRGHEHKVMAMVVVDETLCVSGDSGSGIFLWGIGSSPGPELLQRWYEHSDWRYSGIHSLAVSGGYLYTGSGDKSIKAWSLQDYSLARTMTGHSSTVSALAVSNGILYSGSWDGNIRLWCLGDHSLLSVLEDDPLGHSILSLSVDQHFLVSAHENGSIKIWKDDIFVRARQIQDGAIFAVHMDRKWLFAGGWSKIINIQELTENELEVDIKPAVSITCDSVITSTFYWQGKLFVGFSSGEIKVYYYDAK